MLRFCKRYEKTLADKVFERVPTEDAETLSSMISFYLDTQQPEKACNVFELHFAVFFDEDIDADLEWRLMVAAVECGHQALAEQLYETSPYSYPVHVCKIQQWWKRTAAQGGAEAFRIRRMHDMLARLSSAFQEQYLSDQESSEGESTCFLGDAESNG